MMSELTLQKMQSPQQEVKELSRALEEMRLALVQAEAALAEEQAAVNRFRMHCRLKIGDWVDRVVELRAEYQDLLAKLTLMREAEDAGSAWHEDHWWDEVDPLPEEAVLLPTDVPRDKSAEKRLYRQLVKKFHPDLMSGGVERAYATTMMAMINNAYEKGQVEVLQHFAGELEPELVARLSGGDSAEIRRLRQRLLNCQRRRHKVAQQLQALREENSAKLWRRASRLEEQGLNWWDEVREELQRDIDRLEPLLIVLRAKAKTA